MRLRCTGGSCRLEEAHQSLEIASKSCETDKERNQERSLDRTSKASIKGEGADSKEIQGKTSTDSKGSGSESPSNSSVSRQNKCGQKGNSCSVDSISLHVVCIAGC